MQRVYGKCIYLLKEPFVSFRRAVRRIRLARLAAADGNGPAAGLNLCTAKWITVFLCSRCFWGMSYYRCTKVSRRSFRAIALCRDVRDSKRNHNGCIMCSAL